jgi:hypothetical protein
VLSSLRVELSKRPWFDPLLRKTPTSPSCAGDRLSLPFLRLFYFSALRKVLQPVAGLCLPLAGPIRDRTYRHCKTSFPGVIIRAGRLASGLVLEQVQLR